MKIGQVTLCNKTGGNIRLRFIYVCGNNKIKTRGSEFFPCGKSVTVNPCEYGVPECGEFYIYANQEEGGGRISCQCFVYSSTADRGVAYSLVCTNMGIQLRCDHKYDIDFCCDCGCGCRKRWDCDCTDYNCGCNRNCNYWNSCCNWNKCN